MATALHALHPDLPRPSPQVVELTILMPCLNEAETLASCISKARLFLSRSGISGEVLIADNGSTDGSIQIANALGARVVPVASRGYGAALQGGIEAARGTYIAMGDADDSYDFLSLLPFVEAARAGADLVMGNRFAGGIAPGAMPLLHRYLGNPVLSFIGRLFFRAPIKDFHCGLRLFRRDAIAGLQLRAPGMEFASEMVVKAALQGLAIAEVPTTLQPDGRSRPPHLRTWRDGWRHLRFLLTYAPKWLFFYPGIALLLAGLSLFGFLLPGAMRIGGVELGVTSQMFAAVAIMMGLQLCSFAILARQYGICAGLWPGGPMISRVRTILTVERGTFGGLAMLLASMGLATSALWLWSRSGFGAMDPAQLMRLTIPAALLGVAGLQAMFTSFFLFLLDQPVRRV
jgi:glycosyltransferase involved in cell wall biosynthesis